MRRSGTARHTFASVRRCSAVASRFWVSVRLSNPTCEGHGGTMPGAMHRMGVYLGLVEDEEYGDVENYGHPAERTPARRDDYAEHRYSRETVEAHGHEYDDQPRGNREDYRQPSYQITALHP